MLIDAYVTEERSSPFPAALFSFRTFAFSLSISKPESGSDGNMGILRNGALAMRWVRPCVDGVSPFAFACRRGWRAGRGGGDRGRGSPASAVTGGRDEDGARAERFEGRAIGAGGANSSDLDIHTKEDLSHNSVKLYGRR